MYTASYSVPVIIIIVACILSLFVMRCIWWITDKTAALRQRQKEKEK